MSILSIQLADAQQATPMQTIHAGVFIPLYGSTEEGNVRVGSFQLDRFAVTNAQYLDFLKQYPSYQSSICFKELFIALEERFRFWGFKSTSSRNEYLVVCS